MTKNQINFALKLFKHSSPANESNLLSPFAIISALSILYQGAAGDTRVEMTKIGGGQSAQIFDNYPYCVIHYLNSDEGNNSIVGGSSRLWAQLNFLINPSFQNIISMLHSIKIKHLNFSHGDDDSLVEATSELLFDNDYNKTSNVIIINFGVPLLFASELHLKLEWKYQFVLPSYRTRFIRSLSQTIDIQMITRTANFPYYEDQNVQVVSLPLQKSEMRMIIILPKKVFGLTAIEKQLTAEKLLHYIYALDASDKFIKTMVTIPKFFSIKYIKLSDGLKSIGLLSMFTESANFAIISDQPLSITEFGNLASMHITENGINVKYEDSSTDYNDDGSILNDEIEMNNPLLMQASRIFDSDHPFIYFISDKRKNILWIGRYTADEHGTAINEEMFEEYDEKTNEFINEDYDPRKIEKSMEKTTIGEDDEFSVHGIFSGAIQTPKYGVFSRAIETPKHDESSGAFQTSKHSGFSGAIQPTEHNQYADVVNIWMITNTSKQCNFQKMTNTLKWCNQYPG